MNQSKEKKTLDVSEMPIEKVEPNSKLVENLVVNIEKRGDIPNVVVAHVERNLLLATDISSICVDGGYTKTEALGELARPGADLGISLSLIGSGLTPKEAFLAVYDYRISQGQKYGWHTDTHEGHDDVVVGCGHCNAAITKSSHYEKINEDDVRKLLNIIKQYQNSNPENMRFIELDRDHAEQGILVINNKDVTISPWDQEDDKDTQFFVYDAARDKELLLKIVEFVNKRNLKDNQNETIIINYEDFKEIVDKHTEATLGLLGSSKGKPMYAISVENGKLIIEETGNAPSIDED